jgi:hypothetical protein
MARRALTHGPTRGKSRPTLGNVFPVNGGGVRVEGAAGGGGGGSGIPEEDTCSIQVARLTAPATVALLSLATFVGAAVPAVELRPGAPASPATSGAAPPPRLPPSATAAARSAAATAEEKRHHAAGGKFKIGTHLARRLVRSSKLVSDRIKRAASEAGQELVICDSRVDPTREWRSHVR